MGPLERAAPNSASAHGYDARFARAGHAVAGSLGRRVIFGKLFLGVFFGQKGLPWGPPRASTKRTFWVPNVPWDAVVGVQPLDGVPRPRPWPGFAKRKSRKKCTNIKNQKTVIPQALQEETLKDKFDDGDKDKIEKAVQGALDWLEKYQLTAKDECEAKQEELEGVVNPM